MNCEIDGSFCCICLTASVIFNIKNSNTVEAKPMLTYFPSLPYFNPRFRLPLSKQAFSIKYKS